MNKLLPIFICLLFVGSFATDATAQNRTKKEYKVPISNGNLLLDGIDDVIIQGYDGKEVVFSSMVKTNGKSSRSTGLRVLNSEGLEDNTGFGVSVEQDGNTVSARQINNSCSSCKDITVMVPKGVNVIVSHGSHDADEVIVKDFSSELEITTNYHDVILQNVTGPMAVKTVYGGIEGNFNSLSQVASITLYSVYDLVDITLPENARANVTLDAPYGNVYSNADIKIKQTHRVKNSNSCSSSGSTIEGVLNGGGVALVIKSAYDDIYLRNN